MLFDSGVYFEPLTFTLERKENKRGVFYDTPGLDDSANRKAAAKAITYALREGGPYKILFFIRAWSRRVNMSDVATMKLVLDATPEVGNKYGILINNVEAKMAKALQEKHNLETLLTEILIGVDPDRRCAPSNVMVVQRIDKLEGANNALIDANELVGVDGMTLSSFLLGQVPIVNLKEGHASDIKYEYFNVMRENLEEMTLRLVDNREEFEKLEKQIGKGNYEVSNIPSMGSRGFIRFYLFTKCTLYRCISDLSISSVKQMLENTFENKQLQEAYPELQELYEKLQEELSARDKNKSSKMFSL